MRGIAVPRDERSIGIGFVPMYPSPLGSRTSDLWHGEQLRVSPLHHSCPKRLWLPCRPGRISQQALLMSADANQERRVAAKHEFLSAVSSLDLGRSALDNPGKQATISRLIEAIEAENPTPNPAHSPLVNGLWRLVFSDSADTLGAKRASSLQASYLTQRIEMNEDCEGTFEILEGGKFSLVGIKIPWKNVISGQCKAATLEANKGDSLKRLTLKFESLKLGGVFNIKFPGPAIGWQDNTYLDDDMRIVHTNKGNVTVLQRDET